jgi:hypothetical protein
VWLWSSRSTYYDPEGRYTAAARKYMHALCGQVIGDDQVRELLEESGLPFALCGLRCLVLLEWYESATGRKRLGAWELCAMSGNVWWSR